MTEPRFLAEPLRAHLRFSPTSRPRENGCNSVSSGTRSRPGGSHKHDMSKEDCKPLQLIASAHCLRSRTHNGGQSGLRGLPGEGGENLDALALGWRLGNTPPRDVFQHDPRKAAGESETSWLCP
jgi:hypothetical protein